MKAFIASRPVVKSRSLGSDGTEVVMTFGESWPRDVPANATEMEVVDGHTVHIFIDLDSKVSMIFGTTQWPGQPE